MKTACGGTQTIRHERAVSGTPTEIIFCVTLVKVIRSRGSLPYKKTALSNGPMWSNNFKPFVYFNSTKTHTIKLFLLHHVIFTLQSNMYSATLILNKYVKIILRFSNPLMARLVREKFKKEDKNSESKRR